MGWTPLYRAAFANGSECVSALVACGADISFITENGATPIAHSIYFNNIGAVEALCREGAKLNWDETRGDGNVLSWAAWYGTIIVMDILATTPTERIFYDPDLIYYHFEHNRDGYIGLKEDADELRAAFENLLHSIGTPVPDLANPDGSYKYIPSANDNVEDSEDETSEWETVSNVSTEHDIEEEDSDSDGENMAEDFHDALEAQDIGDSVSGRAVSATDMEQESGAAVVTGAST
jgi:ankyrin repeat protein